jgi:hypothetical protein
VYNFHTFTAAEVTWLSQSTYAEYNSSPGCYRAFCKNCGSPISWTDHGANSDIELAVGTIDEEFLVGKRNANGKAIGAFALVLANPECDHFHIRNEIPGVTEEVSAKGTKFMEGSAGGPIAKG